MKFNEKLIGLRRKEGLSQEELGYKLNVTRQTVSKWELGQTTPEMDKLVEMSKLFNISVDELINESESTNSQNTVIEDQPISKNSNNEKNIKILIIVALIIVIAFIAVKLLAGFAIFNKGANVQGNIFDKVFSIFDKGTNKIDKTTDVQETIFDKFFSIFDKINDNVDKSTEEFNEADKQIAIKKFNGPIEMHNGTNMGIFVKEILDDIITSNKTQDKKIIVKYMETESQDSEEIKNLKVNISDFDSYEISFEYDEKGYINKLMIERVDSQLEEFF